MSDLVYFSELQCRKITTHALNFLYIFLKTLAVTSNTSIDFLILAYPMLYSRLNFN